MKKASIALLFALFIVNANAQRLIGAWETNMTAADGQKLKMVVVFSDNYQVATTYNAKTGAFISTNGGSWELVGNTITEVAEFNSSDTEAVGREVSFDIELSENTMSIPGYEMTFKRIDDGSPGDLQGAWLMSGRKRDGEIQQRDTSRPRKTMKILSGTRFQWIAYNTETKQFMGTGGGTYTTVDGKYTENIEFFSKDNSRVGASLAFDFDLKEGDWHHSGFSSKGAALYEIWSARKE